MDKALMLGIGIFTFGCAFASQLGPEQCQVLVGIAEEIAVEIEFAEISDVEKARQAEMYTRIAAQIAALGCEFIPPPEAPD